MQGVLYVSHGSRVEEARREAIEFMQSVRQRVDVALQEICFLELAEPDIAEGIERLIDRGATRIAVVPVLLLSAGHYYKDIPEEIGRAKARHPQVRFQYGEPLGVQDRIVDILVERIEETKAFRHSDALVLLVGRGGRNPEIPRSIEEIAGKLQAKLAVSKVNTCYLAACPPSFDEGLQEAVKGGKPQVIVVPYLWFTGLLMRSMEKKINSLSTKNQEFILCQYLGNHPAMVDALADRVHETLQVKESRS
ncbi:sirohydrochlorin chelatase [Planococcus lenghuensis]|uniref:Sirohydrochlorin chelatase n=1 Tax=Planococcus lenghuensis TaxID=2213202 RepID=A0A1Q2KZF0_9BACL|nr:sirohydrochlorin chelatase [Planococcus lenghuensis]AQQ53578.1 sirohydrochlorin chelatase [Planococcus lenghuensis]